MSDFKREWGRGWSARCAAILILAFLPVVTSCSGEFAESEVTSKSQGILGDLDNDGVGDIGDLFPLDPNRCRDADLDLCDDCSLTGADGSGGDIGQDGADFDGDGRCDLGDLDDDNDGVVDLLDVLPLDASVCLDADGDGCSDCIVTLGDGSGGDPNQDGPDQDGDGQCDEGDTDDDNDGVLDLLDDSPLNPAVCIDLDGDGCSDCALTGANGLGGDPLNDGLDLDGDGLCDYGDLDDDNDGIPDLLDGSPLNPNVCVDLDSDGCDDCANTGANASGGDPSNDGIDIDLDGLCDFGDLDNDNDGVLDLLDSAPLNPNICLDADFDGCDDCSVTGANGSGGDTSNDGLDLNLDGQCDAGDDDADQDGVPAGSDSDPADPFQCRDRDVDSCDDCSVTGPDGSGGNIASDGLDSDGDGSCDIGDSDDDNDGVPDASDGAPLDPNACGDQDGDFCDDCSRTGANGSGGDVANDGPDSDGDGICDFGDDDDDNDGVPDGSDPAPSDPNACGDSDGDTCDDCSVTGADGSGGNPSQDGADADADGICDAGDSDDDNDGVDDNEDSDPTDSSTCRDTDADGCDDCSVTGPDRSGGDPSNDGLDLDGDGMCDVDSDGDGVPDDSDADPSDPNACRDADADGCDDCSVTGANGSGGDSSADGDDTDFDGVCDPSDVDVDNDGISDDLELGDTDKDGVPDRYDLDSDNDGIPDLVEAGHPLADINGDGMVDCPSGFKSGDNGLCDDLETSADSGVMDYNRDGIADGPINSDSDPILDFRDLDSDNDTLSDASEAGYPFGVMDDDGNGIINLSADVDGDGIMAAVDGSAGFGDDNLLLVLKDSDEDGVPDFRDRIRQARPTALSLPKGDDTLFVGDLDADVFNINDAGRGRWDQNRDGEVDDLVDLDFDGIMDVFDDSDRDGIMDIDDSDPASFGGAVEPDTDMDGVVNAIDADSDNDGLLDILEGDRDFDFDGVPNFVDIDSDDDGLCDHFESGHWEISLSGNGRIDCPSGFGANGFCDDLESVPESGIPMFEAQNSDGDDAADFIDLDSDNNGIADLEESGANSFQIDRDQSGTVDGSDEDGDGIANAMDRLFGFGDVAPNFAPADINQNGIPDFRDPASDGDGNPDLEHSMNADLDQNHDGVVDSEIDSDLDGVVDDIDLIFGFGAFIPLDSDGDGHDDQRDLDDDNDGILDARENVQGINPDSDADFDRVPNFRDGDDQGLGTSDCENRDGNALCDRLSPLFDLNGDSSANHTAVDADGDFIYDLDESGHGGVDDDRDGRLDGKVGENGIADSAEAAPDSGESVLESDTDSDGSPDFLDRDSDDDGISDAEEAGDRLLATPPADFDGDGIPNFQDLDSDGDGLEDAVERGVGIAPADTDSDGDPDYLDLDSDNDGFPDNSELSGGGCQTAGGGSWLIVLMGLIAIGRCRRRPSMHVAALAIVVSSAALHSQADAQVASNVAGERLELSSDRGGIIDVESASTLGHKGWDTALWLGLADDPVNLVRFENGTPVRLARLVDHRVGGALILSLGLFERLQVSASLPVILSQSESLGESGAQPRNPDTTGVGSASFFAKLALLTKRRNGLNLALSSRVTVPTQSSESYFGEEHAIVTPAVLLSDRIHGFKWALNVGYRFRDDFEFGGAQIRDELLARLGLGYRFDDEGGAPLEVDVSLAVDTPSQDVLGSEQTTYAELKGALAYDVSSKVVLMAGGGVGLADAVGTPDWRFFAGVRIGSGAKRAIKTRVYDRDGDGIEDERDACPDEPEDFDGVDDNDGCPDVAPARSADQDGDGIVDANDKCPSEPEDFDDFADEDGCPDPDNDSDGVFDSADDCPLQPGTAENRGCPVADRDGDGINDGADQCPDEPGEAMYAGCKAPDRDGDGVPDPIDNCPDEAGEAEHQGCVKKQLVRLTRDAVEIMEVVYFDLNKATIKPRSFELLNNVASVIVAHPEIERIRIEGHTDSQGQDAFNLRLSQNRSDSVKSFLIRRGIDPSRFESVGYGETKPIASNDEKDGRAANRRVEFKIVRDGAQ